MASTLGNWSLSYERSRLQWSLTPTFQVVQLAVRTTSLPRKQFNLLERHQLKTGRCTLKLLKRCHLAGLMSCVL